MNKIYLLVPLTLMVVFAVVYKNSVAKYEEEQKKLRTHDVTANQIVESHGKRYAVFFDNEGTIIEIYEIPFE